MEKKTRKKSLLLTNLFILIIAVVIIVVIIIISTYLIKLNNDKKKHIEEEKKQQEIQIQNQKDSNVILYKVNDKGINEYGYITTFTNNSAILLEGITLKDNQEKINKDLFIDLSQLNQTLETYNLLNKVDTIKISDLEDIKIYMESENKIIYIGNFDNLNMKMLYVKKMIEEENGKTGEIFVNDIDSGKKAYFREKIK